MAKMRLDVLMTERGLAESRQKAQAIIMCGQVYVNDRKQTKAGAPVSPEDRIEVRGKTLAYVSRGGLKLEKAMKCWPIDLKGAVCADIGASTGGFTDCMLLNGASRVYAVDVGYNQLDYRLRTDPRVVCMERTNARNLSPELIECPVDFASVDVSFISLNLILPALHTVLRPDAHAVCLVKPQFEAGKDKVGKKGVVRDSAVHLEVLEKVMEYAKSADFAVLVDRSKDAVGVIEKNVAKTKLGDKCRVICGDSLDYLKKQKDCFDILWLDPPYDSGLLKSALRLLLDGGFLKPTSTLVCESREEDIFAGDEELRTRFSVLRHAKYGIAHVTLLKPNPELL